jgi:outer membrane protein assembly factor BamB
LQRPRRFSASSPAALLLLGMFALRGIVGMLEAPGLPILMLGFMGRAGLGLLILGWWCFASRASAIEKLVGIAGFLTVAVIAIACLHLSLQWMGFLYKLFPPGPQCSGSALKDRASQPHEPILVKANPPGEFSLTLSIQGSRSSSTRFCRISIHASS